MTLNSNVLKAVLKRVAGLRKNEFVKISSWSAFATLFRMVAGFVTIKIVSKIIGPAGIALTGQFINGTTIISILGTGCIGQGVTKYIAEYTDDKEKQRTIITNAVRITLVSSLVMMALVLLFYQQLGQYIFKSSQYNNVVIFFGASILFFSLNLILNNIINGFKGFKKYVLINISGSVISLLLTIPIVYFFGVVGALVSYILSQTLIIFVTLYFVRNEAWFFLLKSFGKTDRKTLKLLSGFTLMTFISSLFGPYVQLFIRGYIIDHLSVEDAGIWEGINRLSAMYLSIITTSISIYYLPKLSGIKDERLLRAEIIKTCKIVLPPLALFCLLLFLCRDIVIPIVFTKEFLPMRDLFAVQLFGDFVKIASWLMAFVFWAKAMTRVFIITEIFFSLTLVAFSFWSIRNFGFEGTVYGYAINYCLYFIAVLFILRKLLFYAK